MVAKVQRGGMIGRQETLFLFFVEFFLSLNTSLLFVLTLLSTWWYRCSLLGCELVVVVVVM